MSVLALEGKSHDELVAMIASQQAIIAQQQRAAQRKLTLKVSKKGCIALYGMGRFPVSLYAAQWDKVLGMAEDIRAFAEINRGLLSQGKDDPRFVQVAED